MHKRTKALMIPAEVKAIVLERDKSCICCGRDGYPNAHYISRAHGGLGIEQNIVTLCQRCHHEYDNGRFPELYRGIIQRYLFEKYPGFPDELRVYQKGIYETP